MSTFNKETRDEIHARSKGRCEAPNCWERAKEIDHIIPNTKTNIRIYGNDLIQSAENGRDLCKHHHNTRSIWGQQAVIDLREKWKPFSKSKLNKK